MYNNIRIRFVWVEVMGRDECQRFNVEVQINSSSSSKPRVGGHFPRFDASAFQGALVHLHWDTSLHTNIMCNFVLFSTFQLKILLCLCCRWCWMLVTGVQFTSLWLHHMWLLCASYELLVMLLQRLTFAVWLTDQHQYYLSDSFLY